MPDKKLKGIKPAVKHFMPAPNHIVADKDKYISFWFEYPHKFICKILRVDIHFIPIGNIIVYRRSSGKINIPSGVRGDIIRGVAKKKIHTVILDVYKRQVHPALAKRTVRFSISF